MKKKFVFILTAIMLCLAFVLSACGETDGGNSNSGNGGAGNETGGQTNSQTDGTHDKTDKEAGGGQQETVTDILVAYFSATGTTKGVAEKIASATSGTLYEIVPHEPYTQADLSYGNSSCRANNEQNNPTARPAISGSVENMASYDVVFLGYPIWFGSAPKIIYTFLESYEFAGKTVIPFCTSGSSPISGSLSDIQKIANDATWLTGKRFSSGTSQSAVEEWVASLSW